MTQRLCDVPLEVIDASSILRGMRNNCEGRGDESWYVELPYNIPKTSMGRYLKEGVIDFTPDFLVACEFYLIEPPIGKAVCNWVRTHGLQKSAKEKVAMAVHHGIISPSIIDWFTQCNKEDIYRQGLLFRAQELGLPMELHWFMEWGWLEVVQHLVEGAPDVVAARNKALQFACGYGHLPIVKNLVESGADVTADGNNAMRWASEAGNLHVVQYLVSLGVDTPTNDYIALRSASGEGHLTVVKYFVERGVGITPFGLTQAMECACQGGHIDVVTYFVELGVDVTTEIIMQYILQVNSATYIW